MPRSDAEITVLEKNGGPLTKRISLSPDGKVKSDGSACIMAQGSAHRMQVSDVGDLAGLIEHVQSNQALALGMLRPGLPDRVTIVTKRKLASLPDAIARTRNDIIYRKQQPAFALLDFDRKDLPASTADAINARGGLWPVLLSIVPALLTSAHVVRSSTSSGLFRADTGEQLPGSGGQHIFVAVRDGSDIERFLKSLHERCWLAGFGWFVVGAGGQLLERSIIDRMVGAPERLVFEGTPILEPPVQQDRATRRPVPVAGGPLDTLTACPPLDIAEASKLRELKLKGGASLRNDAAKARRAYEERRVAELAQRRGLSLAAAKQQIVRLCEGVLLPDVVLPFDDEDLDGCTVADVLADPVRFDGATLADPLEGIDYGRCVARIMRRDDGTPWIHSFAHGRNVYELKHNAASVRAALDKVAETELAETFLALALNADLNPAELAKLRHDVAKRSGIGVREIAAMLKAAQQERTAKHKQEARERRARERTDPRLQLPRPANDADWLPQMHALNSVISKSDALHPPARDIDDVAAKGRQIALPKMHAFMTSDKPGGGLQ
jgi:hypothetical protein